MINKTENESLNIDPSIQPNIKDGNLIVLLKGIFIQILPFGTLMVLIQGIKYMRRNDVSIYVQQPIKVKDRRHKVGYRIEGYSIVSTNNKRTLSEDEKTRSKKRGLYYLISIPVFFSMIGLLLLYKDSIISKKKNFAVITSSKGLHLRTQPNSKSKIISTILEGDTILLIKENGPDELIGNNTGNWSQIKYKEMEGWVWGDLIRKID